MAELRPITRDVAFPFIRQHHRHHDVPQGGLWWHAAHDDNGVLPNQFEMLSLAQLAETFGYTVAVDCECAGIIGTHPEADKEQGNE